MKQKISTRKLVLTALLAALTVAGSAIRVTLPIDIGGNTSFHLGNIMCALAGLLLGPWYGALAAGIGSMLYDFTNPLYISESWITLLTKGAYGLVAGLVFLFASKLFKKQEGAVWTAYVRAILATAAGAVTYAVLYLAKSYIKGIVVSGLTNDRGMLALAAKLPATIFNGVVAIIFAPILFLAIRKALQRNHLSLDGGVPEN